MPFEGCHGAGEWAFENTILRAFLYGLGALGQPGVTKALEVIHNELDLAMAFCGHTYTCTVDSRILLPAATPS